uniref:Uncharacterized protein n=1 Tax=Rhizophora mucronata TaxID=61149 RepID=A0A2P2LMT0_RHIMU
MAPAASSETTISTCWWYYRERQTAGTWSSRDCFEKD